MTAPPRVTAIIIVYNGEAFLDEAIASVKMQTFPDWELLIVDDGSSDASREIAARHASDDGRINVLEHPDRCNHGMSATRNLGVAHARGEFVGFIDADDVWLPSKLARTGRRIRRASRGRDGLRAHADLARLGPGSEAPRLLLRPRRHAGPCRHAARCCSATWCATSSRRLRTCNALMRRAAIERGRRIRGLVQGHVRGPGVLRQVARAVPRVRVRSMLGEVPTARPEQHGASPERPAPMTRSSCDTSDGFAAIWPEPSTRGWPTAPRSSG